MHIDAHQHFWQLDRGDYDWLTPKFGPIYRDFLPSDLAPHLEKSGVSKTILVQAAASEAETLFMLDLASRTDFIAGVVGWTDFESDLVEKNIASLASHDDLVGLRPMVQDIPDDDWLARESLAPAFEAMIQNGLVFDALVLPRHLPRLFKVLERHPDLPVVIDHAAKPTIKDGIDRQWFTDMATAAGFPHVSCKLSGLVTEARTDWSTDDLRPVVDHLLKHFRPDRLIWGSDWPVLNLASDYETWWKTTQKLLASLSPEDVPKVLGKNAERIYLS